MIYFDTSFLVPVFVHEVTSREVVALMQGLDSAQFVVSQWVQVEFASMVARSVRMGKLEARVALRANSEFEAIVEKSFVVLLPTPDDYDLARHYLLRFETGLRAGDAFHLAIAKNHGALAIYSLDSAMIKAGASLGLPTIGLQ
jgi:predicted nucleic acid-binding protein